MARHLRAAHPPVTMSIRANALAIPTTGEKHTGLRARLAASVVGWAKETPEGAQVGVASYPSRSFGGDAYFTLPAYMEGVKPRWRHPLFGSWEHPQQQEPHPWFYPRAPLLKVTAEIAVRGALDEVSRDLS
jgi:hypothetical protein